MFWEARHEGKTRIELWGHGRALPLRTRAFRVRWLASTHSNRIHTQTVTPGLWLMPMIPRSCLAVNVGGILKGYTSPHLRKGGVLTDLMTWLTWLPRGRHDKLQTTDSRQLRKQKQPAWASWVDIINWEEVWSRCSNWRSSCTKRTHTQSMWLQNANVLAPQFWTSLTLAVGLMWWWHIAHRVHCGRGQHFLRLVFDDMQQFAHSREFKSTWLSPVEIAIALHARHCRGNMDSITIIVGHNSLLHWRL